MTDHTPLKRCSKCGIEKPATTEYFHNRGGNRPGLRELCIECRSTAGNKTRKIKLDVPAGFKYCCGCKEVKPLNEDYFIKQKDKASGWASHCKKCASEYHQQYYLKNTEEIRTRNKKWWRANPDKVKGYSSASDKKDYQRKYRAKHSIRLNAQISEWRKENKIKAGIYGTRRRAIKKSLPSVFSNEDWQHALEFFGYSCAVCGRHQGLWHTLAADHWIPLNSPLCPGTIPTNIVPLCHGVGGCNNSKGDKNAEEWLVQKFGKRKAKQILEKIETYFEWVKNADSRDSV